MRAGAKVLNQMPPETQEDILQDLFDQGDRGARFTVGKVPIAATDFAPPKWYSYADEEQDESMPDFSIDYDLDEKEGFIPYVKRATEIVGKNVLWFCFRCLRKSRVCSLFSQPERSVRSIPSAECPFEVVSRVACFRFRHQSFVCFRFRQ